MLNHEIGRSIDKNILFLLLSGVLFLALFGFISVANIPVQLVPTVEQPVINISTTWPGASPQEVEREITIKTRRNAQRGRRNHQNDQLQFVK